MLAVLPNFSMLWLKNCHSRIKWPLWSWHLVRISKPGSQHCSPKRKTMMMKGTSKLPLDSTWLSCHMLTTSQISQETKQSWSLNPFRQSWFKSQNYWSITWLWRTSTWGTSRTPPYRNSMHICRHTLWTSPQWRKGKTCSCPTPRASTRSRTSSISSRKLSRRKSKSPRGRLSPSATSPRTKRARGRRKSPRRNSKSKSPLRRARSRTIKARLVKAKKSKSKMKRKKRKPISTNKWRPPFFKVRETNWRLLCWKSILSLKDSLIRVKNKNSLTESWFTLAALIPYDYLKFVHLINFVAYFMTYFK